MSYNGYSNEATYTVELLTSNERKVYFPIRAIVMEHRNPKVAAPYVRDLVHRALRGDNHFLTADERRAWNADIKRSGGLGDVNWEEIAETQGAARTRPRHPKGRGECKGIQLRLTRRSGRRRYRAR